MINKAIAVNLNGVLLFIRCNKMIVRVIKVVRTSGHGIVAVVISGFPITQVKEHKNASLILSLSQINL